MVETPAKSADSLTVGMLAQRLDGMDKAIELLQAYANRQPSPEVLAEQIIALKELKAAHFQALRELMDARFAGNQTALDAALKTQKEASDKIESNFTKQNDNVVANIQTLTKSFDDKISDLKDRFNTTAGHGSGLRDGWGWLIGVAALAIPIVLYLVK